MDALEKATDYEERLDMLFKKRKHDTQLKKVK
jgi:hypothetical protein